MDIVSDLDLEEIKDYIKEKKKMKKNKEYNFKPLLKGETVLVTLPPEKTYYIAKKTGYKRWKEYEQARQAARYFCRYNCLKMPECRLKGFVLTIKIK